MDSKELKAVVDSYRRESDLKELFRLAEQYGYTSQPICKGKP
jgi:predicted kinase